MTTPPAPAPGSVAPPSSSASGSVGRLRNGELRAMVARVLADQPGTEFTPRVIAQKLDRSSGAVGNALKVLAERGDAQVCSTMPLKYRATSTTPSVAATTIAPGRASSAPRTRRPRTTTNPPAAVGLATPAASVLVTGPVPRPNGTAYHPRLLSGIPDVTALRKLREAGVAALMYGPPGTGKTSVVEAAFPDLLRAR
jgi:nitric oxide reductase NorQ protein